MRIGWKITLIVAGMLVGGFAGSFVLGFILVGADAPAAAHQWRLVPWFLAFGLGIWGILRALKRPETR